MEITVPLDLLIEVGVMIAGLATMWAIMTSRIDELRRQVEEHAPDVRKISPIETSLELFKSEVERRLGGIERKVDDVHSLLLRAAAISR